MAERIAQHYADRIEKPMLASDDAEALLVELAEAIETGSCDVMVGRDDAAAIRWILKELEARRSEELGRPR